MTTEHVSVPRELFDMAREQIERQRLAALEYGLIAVAEANAYALHKIDAILTEPAEVSEEMVVKTAPERIYLQISDDESDKDEPFPDEARSEITWCSDSVMDCEVEYVRADLAERKEPGQ